MMAGGFLGSKSASLDRVLLFYFLFCFCGGLSKGERVEGEDGYNKGKDAES